MNSPVSPTNDPIIRALINDMQTATNAEAGEIALAMQRVIRGENLDDTHPDLANKYREVLATMDQDAAAFVENKKTFIETAYDEAAQSTEKEKVGLREKANARMNEHRAMAKMRSSDKVRWMTDQLKHGEKVKVYVEPKVQMGSIGGQPASAIEGVMIRINGVSVYLEPGENWTHPIIAQRYEQIKRSAQETLKRKALLQGAGIASKEWTPGKPDGWQQTARKMAEIDAEYDSKGEDWSDPTLHRNF